MRFFVNNNEYEINKEKVALKDVFELLSIDNTSGIAVAVNGQLVPKSKWNDFYIRENDKMIIVKAAPGG